MKYTPAKIAECVAWVEKNGLHPQRCGATLRKFQEAMGIDDATYRRWLQKAEFADALAHARDVFTATIVEEVSNAVARAARGAEYSIVQEVKQIDKATGKLVTVKATRKTFYKEPDMEAAKFLLTNIQGDDWRLKQEQTIKTEAPVYQVNSQEEAEKLRNIGKPKEG